MAVDVLGEAAKYGLDGERVVSAHRFNYLLSQLYIAGDSESELAFLGPWSMCGILYSYPLCITVHKSPLRLAAVCSSAAANLSRSAHARRG